MFPVSKLWGHIWLCAFVVFLSRTCNLSSKEWKKRPFIIFKKRRPILFTEHCYDAFFSGHVSSREPINNELSQKGNYTFIGFTLHDGCRKIIFRDLKNFSFGMLQVITLQNVIDIYIKKDLIFLDWICHSGKIPIQLQNNQIKTYMLRRSRPRQLI